jgi:predicted DNA-binding protein (MmcQ/YjbR family)
MTLQNILGYCLKKKGAYLDFPFGAEYAIVKVKAPSREKGRVFGRVDKTPLKRKKDLKC